MPIFFLFPYILSRSVGDICKGKLIFWWVHNSFSYYLYLKPKIPRKIYALFSTLILFPCKVNFLIKRLISPCAAAPAGHSQACWTFQDLHTGPTFQTLKMTSRKAKKSVLNKISQIDLGALTFLEIKNRNWKSEL